MLYDLSAFLVAPRQYIDDAATYISDRNKSRAFEKLLENLAVSPPEDSLKANKILNRIVDIAVGDKNFGKAAIESIVKFTCENPDKNPPLKGCLHRISAIAQRHPELSTDALSGFQKISENRKNARTRDEDHDLIVTHTKDFFFQNLQSDNRSDITDKSIDLLGSIGTDEAVSALLTLSSELAIRAQCHLRNNEEQETALAQSRDSLMKLVSIGTENALKACANFLRGATLDQMSKMAVYSELRKQAKEQPELLSYLPKFSVRRKNGQCVLISPTDPTDVIHNALRDYAREKTKKTPADVLEQKRQALAKAVKTAFRDATAPHLLQRDLESHNDGHISAISDIFQQIEQSNLMGDISSEKLQQHFEELLLTVEEGINLNNEEEALQARENILQNKMRENDGLKTQQHTALYQSLDA